MHTRGAWSPRRGAPGPLATGGTLLVALVLAAGCAPAATVVEAPAEAAATTAAPARAPAAPAPLAEGPDQSAAGPVTEEDAVALAAALTAALATGEPGGWAAHFAPADGMRSRQRDWFAAVQATPMTVREVHPLLLRPARPGRDAELTVGFRHQVTGADPVPAVERYRYLLARAESGAVRVTAVDGGGGLAVDHPQLWDLVPTAVTVTDHLVLLHPADRRARAMVADSLSRLDEAAADALADFPVPEVDRLVVTAAPPDLVEEVFGGDVQEVLGFATAVPAAPEVQEHDGMVVLPSDRKQVARAAVDLEYLEWEDWDGTRSTGGSPLMRHEGVHALMVVAEPTARPARWVSEGLAGWYESAGDPDERALARDWLQDTLSVVGLPDGLPPVDARAFHDDEEDLHYLLSASVFQYLEERHGADTVREVGVALHGVAGGNSAVSAVLEEHLDTDRAGLEADWLDWLAAQQ